ncbi:hypothetical protein LTR84_010431 [Exophiala bonariae]|uniref:Uncharacterized protein n=1 Tax=Exophiala bonariae TaxID=1690606 RepID=A0AAV9MVQ0_9EURO|nr:hypothetical protein LTR84_010431 [Exophiala bonariae]
MDEWTPNFGGRQAFSLAMANKPHIETLEEVLNDEADDQTVEDLRFQDGGRTNEDDIAEDDEDANPVRMFMRAGHENEVCLPMADTVTEFCQGCPEASLETLRLARAGLSGKAILSSNSVAMVIEQGRDGARLDIMAFTSLQLYGRLKKARSKRPSSSKTNLGAIQDDEPDAEQQLIYITDTDAWAIHSLIGTAPHFQVAHLQTTLYRHLEFKPYCNYDAVLEGLPTFHLTFNLPYFALRSSLSAREDPRKWPNRTPLRQCHDVTLLCEKSNVGKRFFLYEAQISCTIAGPDENIWNGYCLVDNYFEKEGDGETVHSYVEDSLRAQGMRADPFTRGRSEVDRDIATRKPREYFLTILRIRLQQVTYEQEKVVAMLTKCSRRWEQTLVPVATRYSREEAKNSIRTANHHSKKVSKNLSSIITSCEDLCNDRIFRCFDGAESAPYGPLLRPIRTRIKELKRLKEELDQQTDDWTTFKTDFGVDLNMATVNTAGQSMKMMLMISSIGLAFSLFSISKPELVTPFIRQNFWSFLATVGMFGLIGLLFLAVLTGTFQCFVADILRWRVPRWGIKISVSIQSLKLPSLSGRFHKIRKIPEDEENLPIHGFDISLRSLGTTALKPHLNAQPRKSSLTPDPFGR